jgi:hypothetical protein
MYIQPHSRIVRRSQSILVLATLFFIAGVHSARADEIAIWNFNDSDLVVDHGTGTLTSNFVLTNIGFAAGTTNNARLGDVAGQALSLQGGTSNTNNGRNITINVSTVGFSNIVISFATQGTSTGFNSNQFQYSLDGTNFVDFGSPYVPAAAFGAIPLVFTLSGIAGLNNNPNAAFRIVFNGATTSTGNNRIDNIVVEGTTGTTAIPEPTTAVLLFTGITGLIGMKRKRRRAANNATPPSFS